MSTEIETNENNVCAISCVVKGVFATHAIVFRMQKGQRFQIRSQSRFRMTVKGQCPADIFYDFGWLIFDIGH